MKYQSSVVARCGIRQQGTIGSRVGISSLWWGSPRSTLGSITTHVDNHNNSWAYLFIESVYASGFVIPQLLLTLLALTVYTILNTSHLSLEDSAGLRSYSIKLPSPVPSAV